MSDGILQDEQGGGKQKADRKGAQQNPGDFRLVQGHFFFFGQAESLLLFRKHAVEAGKFIGEAGDFLFLVFEVLFGECHDVSPSKWMGQTGCR